MSRRPADDGKDRGRAVDLKKLLRVAAVAAPLLLLPPAVIADGQEFVLSVPGIPGPYCAYGVEKRLFDLDGISRVDLLWEKEQIRILVANGVIVTPAQILTAVEKSDYPYDYKIIDQ